MLKKSLMEMFLHKIIIFCTLICVIVTYTGCSIKEEQVLPEDSGEITAENDVTEGVDANIDDISGEVLIRVIAIDLTNDGVEDKLSLYLTDCDKENIGNVEELVAGGEGSVQVAYESKKYEIDLNRIEFWEFVDK